MIVEHEGLCVIRRAHACLFRLVHMCLSSARKSKRNVWTFPTDLLRSLVADHYFVSVRRVVDK